MLTSGADPPRIEKASHILTVLYLDFNMCVMYFKLYLRPLVLHTRARIFVPLTKKLGTLVSAALNHCIDGQIFTILSPSHACYYMFLGQERIFFET